MAAAVLQAQPGLLGDANRTGLQSLSRLVTDAEAAIQSNNLQLAQACLDTYFAEAVRYHGLSAKAQPADQFACRAHFAAGQLVAQLSSSCKGQQLVDGVQEAVQHIMRGVELASSNPRYSHLVYNGSVHFWHAARPLQCDKLRHHLLQSQEKICQVLEKVEGQTAWRVRHLLSLALCQMSEEGRPDEVHKTLAKALELTNAANPPQGASLRAEVLQLQTHHQTLQAARAAAAKPGGPAAAGGKAAAAAAAAVPASPPPAPAAGKQAAAAGAAAGKRKTAEAQTAGKADIEGALAALQWVLSARPDATAAEQHLQTAWKLVDAVPNKPAQPAQLQVVGRIAWAAAASGARQLAEQCASRAATSQDLGPRVWADLARLLLSLQSAPEAALRPSSCSSGSGAVLSSPAVKARREILEGVDEAVSSFLKLGDVQGVHNCAVLAWNTGLPLLQPQHRSLVKPAFTAVAKALEAVGSPWSKLRAVLHLEVAKAEADADCFMKAAKEVTTALSLNYPSAADMAAVCGYERSLDRYLEPMARAAQLRGVAPVRLDCCSPEEAEETAPPADDDAVLLLERARDSKSAALRAEYLQKAVDKLALLPAVLPPSGPAATEALQGQLRAARVRAQIWAEIIQLAWNPCQLDAVVRSAAPFLLQVDWLPSGDKEMLGLQARAALVAADAAKAALAKLGAEVLLPAGYTPCLHVPASNSSSQPGNSAPAPISKNRATSVRQAMKEQGIGGSVTELQRAVADYFLQSMRLTVAAGGTSWLLMNGAMAVWNSYLPLMQRERYADLAGLLLPVLQQLLEEPSTVQPNQLVMLAEAAAKAAEHTALLRMIQQQQGCQSSTRPPSQQVQGDARMSDLPWYKPLAAARDSTAGLDAVVMLAASSDILQLLSDTASACQAALARATTAAEPQGLIQAYARLQQLQGKQFTVLLGAPAFMAGSSKVLAIIESLTASAPVSGGPAAASTPAPAPAPASTPAAAGRLSSASTGAAAPATAKVSTTGAKTAPAGPVGTGKTEQDIRAGMSLLAAMPSVNMQLWAQLARAAGWHGLWLLARECATAALGGLPPDKRDLSAVSTAADVPEVVGAQSWYWLAVAEMQHGQALLSLVDAAASTGVATSLAVHHGALQHFATATHLASLIRRADLAESAAKLAYNTASGGLLGTAITRAAAVPCLSKVAVALNHTRPTDLAFQVSINSLLLECLAAAGRWHQARRHVETFHRSLQLAKLNTPAACAALDTVAGWRATCIAKASTRRAMDDMPRLLSELSTPQAKAHAWLAFAQASSSTEDQMSARDSALAALDALPPTAKVEYQLEFAEWLATARNTACEAGVDAETLLHDAAAALIGAAGVHGQSTAVTDGSSLDTGFSTQQLEQLVRVYVLLSQVAAHVDDRQMHLLQAQGYTEQLLTVALLAAGAEAPVSTPDCPEPATEPSVPGSNPGAGAVGDTASVLLAAASCDAASTAVQSQSSSSPAAAAVPALQLPSRPATAATAASCTTRSQAHTDARCLASSLQLPADLLGWANWLPDEDLLNKLQHAWSQEPPAEDSSSNGISSEPASSSPSLQTDTAAAGSCVPGATSTCCSLTWGSVQAPELLLVNLEVLSRQLQEAAHYAAALPVLQLARLLALVVLKDQGMAAAMTLQLATLCKLLGLTSAAAGWLRLAAPEQWPSPEQQMQAQQSMAVQQLAHGLLLQHGAGAGSTDAARDAQQHEDCKVTSFILAGIKEADASAVQAWLQGVTSRTPGSSQEAQAHSTLSSTSSRPPSAAGTGAAAAALAAGGGHGVEVLRVKPLSMLDSWARISRYLVDHAQFTAGQKLCRAALDLARSSCDTHCQAQVLLLQARLALLAQENETAVGLAQAAQAFGGDVRFWEESVLCYAAARSRMPGRGPADAVDALAGGVELLATVARGCGQCFQPTVLAASARLKLQLARQLVAPAQQQRCVDDQDELSCTGSISQARSRALALCQEAAADAQEAGTVLLQAHALQQVASHRLAHVDSRLAAPASKPRQQRPHSAAAAAAGDDEHAITAALRCLQAASQALTHIDTQAGAMPLACTTASVLTQLARVELQLSQLHLRKGRSRQAAAEPEFPRVEGRDPCAVIAFLTTANAAASQASSDPASTYLSQALQHSVGAAEAATAANSPPLHAAAVLEVGRAYMLQAHAAILAEDEANNKSALKQVPTELSAGSGGGTADVVTQADAIDTCWVPWPGCVRYDSAAAHHHSSTQLTSPSSGSVAADATGDQPCVGSSAGTGGELGAAACGGAEQAVTIPAGQSASGRLSMLQLPAGAQEPYQQATVYLQQALQEALEHQQLHTAQAAAQELMHCYGQLQPDKAGLCLAMAQSCSSARAMRRTFEQAAAGQHAELLLWRQLQQLESASICSSVQEQQVHHVLNLLGITTKRLQVPQPDTLVPLLHQLRPHQRLLILHHDASKQQLVLAAWGAAPAAPAAGGISSSVGDAAQGSEPAKPVSSTNPAQSARAHRSSAVVKEHPQPAPTCEPAASTHEPAAPAPLPAVLLGSMQCTQQQLWELTATFAAYSRQVQKAVIQAASEAVQQVATPADIPGAAAEGAAPAVGSAKKPQPAGAASKAGGKDKGSKQATAEVPPWVPPAPVFPQALNEDWQRIMQQFEAFLQPLAAVLADALRQQQQQPVPAAEAPAAVAAAATGTKKSTGTKATAAAAPAEAVPPALLSLQLLLDPELCHLPWEALPVLRHSCGSIARCFSLAQLQQVMQPPQATVQAGQQSRGLADPSASAAPAAVLDLNRLGYLVDPLHHMSSSAEHHGCYAAPLLPCFRQDVLDVWGQSWQQGCAGTASQLPCAEELLRPLHGSSRGLLALTPGRLLSHVGSQAVAALDLGSCTAALLFDRLDNPAALAHHTKVDNRKTAAERALESPSQTAMLLLLRGVRAVALAALPGTPHTHVQLAVNVLRGLSGQPLQQLQAPIHQSANSQTAPATGPMCQVETAAPALTSLVVAGPLTLSEAVMAACRQGLAGFELQALSEAGMVVYGWGGVVAASAAAAPGGGAATGAEGSRNAKSQRAKG